MIRGSLYVFMISIISLLASSWMALRIIHPEHLHGYASELRYPRDRWLWQVVTYYGAVWLPAAVRHATPAAATESEAGVWSVPMCVMP